MGDTPPVPAPDQLPDVHLVVQQASQLLHKFAENDPLATTFSPTAKGLVNVPPAFQCIHSLRTKESQFLPENWGIVDSHAIETRDMVLVPRLGSPDRVRQLKYLLSLSPERRVSINSQQLANALGTLEWIWKAMARLHSKERIRMAQEIGLYRTATGQIVLDKNSQQPRIVELDEENAALIQAIEQQEAAIKVLSANEDEYDDENQELKNKVRELKSKVRKLESKVKDKEIGRQISEKDYVEEQARANFYEVKCRKLEENVALTTNASESDPRQGRYETTMDQSASNSHINTSTSDPQSASEPHISITAYVLVEDGDFKKHDQIMATAKNIPTSRALVNLVRQKYSKSLTTMVPSKHAHSKLAHTMKVANPLAGSAEGWSELEAEKYDLWMKMVQNVSLWKDVKHGTTDGGLASSNAREDHAKADGHVAVFVGPAEKESELKQAAAQHKM